MSAVAALPRYSVGEELANSITHGVGILFGISALCIMTTFAALYGDVWHIVGCSVFGAALVLLYTFSTLYHSVTVPRLKSVLRVFDHSAIYLLIAGTYTPFTLVSLRGAWGWVLFGGIWAAALVGIVLKIISIHRWEALSLGLYAGMGWSVVVAVKPLLSSVDTGGLAFLLFGGLAYTFGIVFYVWEKLPFNHAIWHLFVLTGSILHFFAVLFYVIPIFS
ncbi:PAQR family membrane homeostasis protein TrhA [Desulfoluna butyratoxydans]|uniref:Hly-iii n=1 Tax=Desulfoluna butyratoxydans TaxID=231438 RepID=A0A4U8YIS9_9BACT|nr:hemolysin III family protein [Desulfoluna butyratoxydans]VFQ43501.1 hly-iii [Desulfoluna butyratoxydans]